MVVITHWHCPCYSSLVTHFYPVYVHYFLLVFVVFFSHTTLHIHTHSRSSISSFSETSSHTPPSHISSYTPPLDCTDRMLHHHPLTHHFSHSFSRTSCHTHTPPLLTSTFPIRLQDVTPPSSPTLPHSPCGILFSWELTTQCSP